MRTPPCMRAKHAHSACTIHACMLLLHDHPAGQAHSACASHPACALTLWAAPPLLSTCLHRSSSWGLTSQHPSSPGNQLHQPAQPLDPTQLQFNTAQTAAALRRCQVMLQQPGSHQISLVTCSRRDSMNEVHCPTSQLAALANMAWQDTFMCCFAIPSETCMHPYDDIAHANC